MSHFKYEIDERNLRLQLKSNEISFSEEAWQKFENFSATGRSPDGDDAIKRFSLSLNRNVILPIVFGGVIILFSLLLFNFINIKNPNTAREARAEVKKQPVAEPRRIDKKEPEAILKLETQLVAPSENALLAGNAAEPAAVIETPKTFSSADPIKNNITQLPTAKEAIAITKPETTANNVSTTRAYAAPAKQLKKRSVVITEATAAEDEQAPPPVSEPAAQNGELK